MKITQALLLGAAACSLHAPGATAQENVDLSHYTSHVDGAVAPHLIPEAQKIRSLVSRFPRGENLMLSDVDAASFDAFENRQTALERDTTAALQQRLQEICGSVEGTSSFSITSILAEIRAAEIEADRKTVAAFDAMLRTLSATGGSTVKKAIEQEIAPTVQHTTVDVIAASTAHPEFFAQRFLRACEAMGTARARGQSSQGIVVK